MDASQGSARDARARVLEATDLVDLIGQTVKLTRRGVRMVGLCPFHSEKTPSFHVRPDKQLFYCFGCKAAGNAIDFVMRRDRVEFIDALRSLAERAGIALPRRGETGSGSERQLLLDAHTAAAALFEKWLSLDGPGASARAYLAGRGFAPATLRAFRVGAAPDLWDALLRAPEMRRFPPALLARAGLVRARPDRGDSFYDTFRNRILFPIRDESSRVIAFGGRVMPGSDDPAKYLNSPETPLFSKGRCVFGLDLARPTIVETRQVAVVEGYTDVMMAHQFGAAGVVSVLGTAMTEQHVSILRRYADRIVLLFDADAAGEAAMNRVVELYLSQPVEIAVATMPAGLDPDELLLRDGVAGFDAVLRSARDALTYAWDVLSGRMGGDLTSRQKAVQQYLHVLGAARGGSVDVIRWGEALLRVARLTGVPVDDLNRRFARPSPRRRPSSAPAEAPAPATRASAQGLAERWLIAGLLTAPQHWHQVQTEVSPEQFAPGPMRQVAQRLWDQFRDEGEPETVEFIGALEQTSKPLVMEAIEEMERLGDVGQCLRDALAHFRRGRESRERGEKRAQLGGPDEAARLAELQELNRAGDRRRVGPVRRLRP